MAEKTARKQRGRPFPKGKSGNPCGRPVGALNRSTMLAQAILAEEAVGLARKAVALALKGDIHALRLVIERIIPPKRERAIEFHLPSLTTPAEVNSALSQLVGAVADGTLSPGEGETFAGLLELQRRSIESVDLESRIRRLEEVLQPRDRR